jgi:hypothetical protein
MAPSYTITSGDVASVDPSSALVAGTIFDYGIQRITVPNSVAFVDAQWIVDNCRFVEATLLGVSRKPIIEPYGKYTKGIDPLTGLPVKAGIEVILLDGWLIATAKSSGLFLVRDVFKSDGSFPIFDNPAVEIRYQTSQGISLVQLTAGGGDGFTPSDRSILQTTQSDAAKARKAVTNRYRIDDGNKTGTLYEDDGVTPLITHNLKDKTGIPSSNDVYERAP